MNKLINDLSDVCEVPRSTVVIVAILFFNERYIIKFEAVDRPSNVSVTALHSNDCDKDVSVIGMPVSSLSVYDKHNETSDEFRVNVLQHLYYRYILGIGDLGTHNILVRTKDQQIFGHDFEEMGGPRNPKSRFECLEKKRHLFREVIYITHTLDIKLVTEKHIDLIKNILLKFKIDKEQIFLKINKYNSF
jgi:hypothetical protein